MKFTTTKSGLLSALNIASKAVADNIITACGMFKFDISKEKIIITSNNQIQQITVEIDCKADFKGVYLFPAKELTALIKALPEQPITFTVEKHIVPETDIIPEQVSYSVTILYGTNGKAKLPLENGDNFPDIKCISDTKITLLSEDFNEGVFRTLHACSSDELRPAFTGVLVEFEDDKIRFSGCDANILATCIFNYKSGLQDKLIIPKNSLKLIQELNPSGEILVTISNSSICLSFNSIEVRSLLIGENPVEFKQVIPTDNSIIACIDKEMFLSALSRVGIFVNRFNNLVQMNITSSVVKLTGEDLNFQRGNSEDVPCECNGEIVIGTNINWLMASIQRVTTPQFWISFKANNRAMVITEYEPVGDTENLMLVMPLWVTT